MIAEKKAIGILDPDGHNLNPLSGSAYSTTYLALAKTWRAFPAYTNAASIISDIRAYQVLLVISGTGSGKTVLFPKYALHAFDYQKKIAVTLPKQLIAKSAAEFAAKTLDVALGQQVGYQYKGANRSGPKTQLLYATDGTIVSRLLRDPLLNDFSAVIIDEAHERKIQIDFLLYLLRNTLEQRPEFKLIIMSATIDEKLFENYFYAFRFKTIHVGAATNYPIETIFSQQPANDKEYLTRGFDAIRQLNDADGDILFFVTSVNETHAVCRDVSTKLDSYCAEVFANMSDSQQELAQDPEKYKASGHRQKVVVATNVAESSLTIDGIKYVIDSGYELANYYDPDKRARVLEKRLISQAQAVQRRGRAGRMAPGKCFHLYTRSDFEHMREFPEPSIRTSNIYDECLRFLNLPSIQTVGALVSTLASFIEPPREIYVLSALSQLVQLGLVRDDAITPLGHLVAELGADPMQGISIVLGYKMNCAREIIAIFSVIDTIKGSLSDLFEKPPQLRQDADVYIRAKRRLYNKYGDHLSILKIFMNYAKFSKAGRASDWCSRHFLRETALKKATSNYHNTWNNYKKPLNAPITGLPDFGMSELEQRVLMCIAYGFRLNTANLSTSKYRVNRDSFLNFHNAKISNIVYNELFSTGGKTEYTIASRLSEQVKAALISI